MVNFSCQPQIVILAEPDIRNGSLLYYNIDVSNAALGSKTKDDPSLEYIVQACISWHAEIWQLNQRISFLYSIGH